MLPKVNVPPSRIYALFGWSWMARLAGQPPHMDTVHMNQPAVLLYHINKPVTIRTSQPNRLLNNKFGYNGCRTSGVGYKSSVGRSVGKYPYHLHPCVEDRMPTSIVVQPVLCICEYRWINMNTTFFLDSSSNTYSARCVRYMSNINTHPMSVSDI